MIREMNSADLDETARIWLDANVEAHGFIPAEYWKNNFPMVKKLLLQAEVYVYIDEVKNEVSGFIGLNENHIEGIFVKSSARSAGIGKALLNFAKEKKEYLTLNVYQKNARAVKFYEREGFAVEREGIDGETGEKDFFMVSRRLS